MIKDFARVWKNCLRIKNNKNWCTYPRLGMSKTHTVKKAYRSKFAILGSVLLCRPNLFSNGISLGHFSYARQRYSSSCYSYILEYSNWKLEYLSSLRMSKTHTVKKAYRSKFAILGSVLPVRHVLCRPNLFSNGISLRHFSYARQRYSSSCYSYILAYKYFLIIENVISRCNP